MILGGDVGGTKCNLALLAETEGKLRPVVARRFASKDYANFDLIVTDFVQQAATQLGEEKITAAGFGVAGPVIENRVKATNLPWVVDGKALAEKLGTRHVVLLNDLAATAHSLEHLTDDDLCVLNDGSGEPGATKALIAAGTGLGEAMLFWDGRRYVVAPSEGGHTDFAPRTEQEIELLRFLKKRAPNVSNELILSGRGFRALHEFLGPDIRHASFDDPEADPAPEITRLGLGRECSACAETLDLWTAIYGAEAGNLALKALSLGGLYVAGGIAVKTLAKMKDGAFVRAFCDKSRFSKLLARIPVSIVLNQAAPLLGAAYRAAAASG